MLIKADMYAAGGEKAELETSVIAVGATKSIDASSKDIMYIVWYDDTLSPALAGSVYEGTLATYGKQSTNLATSFDSTTKTLSITNNHSIAYNVAVLSC